MKILFLILLFYFLFSFSLQKTEVITKEQQEQQKEQEEKQTYLQEQVYLQKQVQKEERKQIQAIEQKKYEIRIMEVTAYAPLDSNAVEGVCFSGDPSVTASGAPVIIGETAAAGNIFPFGTKLYIEEFGWRTVTDRGGMVSDRQLDVAVATQKEALEWGRRNVRVKIPLQ